MKLQYVTLEHQKVQSNALLARDPLFFCCRRLRHRQVKMTARTQHKTQTDVTAINMDRGMAGDSVKPPVEQIKK